MRDLAEELIRRGHTVSVLTPAKHDTDLPSWAVGAGETIPIPFNGSVARLSFTPRSAVRTRKWLDEGDFDVVHIHEPGVPSVSFLALINADVPMVGTFHSAMEQIGRAHV